MSRNRHGDQSRRRIAVEAARLMSESGQRDFHAAKRKAAQRLGISDEASLPSNREIDVALREHQALFQPDHAGLITEMRRIAAEAMRFFARFHPRLVGAVLDGSADVHSAICLHVFAETGTDVNVFLIEQGIDFDESSRSLRYGHDDRREAAVLRFAADGQPFDLTVLAIDDLRQAPVDRISEQPMQRMDRVALLELLARDG